MPHDPLQWHEQHLAFCEAQAERYAAYPDNQAAWEQQAWDTARFIEAIKKDQKRTEKR